MQNLRAILVAALAGASVAVAASAVIVGGVLTASEQTVAQASPAVPVVQRPAPKAARTTPAPVARTAAAPSSTKAKKKAPETTSRKKPATTIDTSRCTNRINYANDPRDNATINSIGEQTGKCPTPLTSSIGGTGGGKGAGYTGTCLDTGTCYDPAGWAPGEGLSDEAYRGSGAN